MNLSKKKTVRGFSFDRFNDPRVLIVSSGSGNQNFFLGKGPQPAFWCKYNKTGLQPVSRPVEQILIFSLSLKKLPKIDITIKVKVWK